jgi:hypothetical protein
VPRLLTGREAWHLSGGLVGSADDTSPVPLAQVCLRAPDAEAFLPDWRAVAQEGGQA